jgi:DNA polymerase IV
LFPELIAGEECGDLTKIGDTEEKHRRLDAALDKLRARYGRDVVYLGAVQDARENAPMRISFTHIPDLAVEDDR